MKITEAEVVASYVQTLRLQVRRMEIEKDLREESPMEFQERVNANCDHANLELRYIAQFTY